MLQCKSFPYNECNVTTEVLQQASDAWKVTGRLPFNISDMKDTSLLFLFFQAHDSFAFPYVGLISDQEPSTSLLLTQCGVLTTEAFIFEFADQGSS
jgi:hypothetical protein